MAEEQSAYILVVNINVIVRLTACNYFSLAY